MIVGPSMPTPIESRMPGTPALEISWLTMTCSLGPIDWPPNSLGHVTPARPASASLPCHARRAATISSSSVSAPSPRRMGASPLCSSSQDRTFWRYSTCSGESFRSTLKAPWLTGQSGLRTIRPANAARPGGFGRDRDGDLQGMRWRLLLILPLVGFLIGPLYAGRHPDFLGVAFFYWYELASTVVSIAITFVVFPSEQPRP